MTLSRYSGLIMRGGTTDIPTPITALNEYLFFNLDTGDILECNGTTWTTISGPSKTETVQNKTISAATNTFVKTIQDPFTSTKREGFIFPSLTAATSLKYAMKGLPTNGTSYSYFFDSTEGYVSRFSTSIVENVGFFSNSTTQIIARRQWLPTFKVKLKVSSTTNSNVYIGFTSNSTFPTGTTPLGSADSGVIVGFNTALTNFSIWNNDGSGVAPAATNFTGPVAKDSTSFHTFEINLNSGNITAKLDTGTVVTISTRIPATSTDLYLVAGQLQNTTATAKTLDISKAYFVSNIT